MLELFQRLAGIRAHEARATLLSAAYFFFLLGGYYVLRPLREEMGLAGGVRNLPWMFQATLVATFALTPLFGWCVQRFPRHVLLPVVYRAFIAQLLLFWALAVTLSGGAEVWLGRAFYVWLSVFNMFVVSVFWAFIADGYGLNQSKRLFGLIAAGGSLGAIVGASITAQLVDVIGRVHLFLVAALLLEIAVRFVLALHRSFETMRSRIESRSEVTLEEERESERAGWRGPLGGAFNGIGQTMRSPYLLAISAFLFLYSLCSTFLYFEQANIVAQAVADRAQRAALFARIDLWVNVLTLAIQLTLSGRIMRWIGIGATLVLLPAFSVAGFVALGIAPILPVLVAFQVFRRASNYALVRPARETLFTIVRREERYKAKSFIDTFVYRGGDSLGSLGFDGLVRTGLSMAGIAYVAAAVAAVWGGVGVWLGWRQERLAAAHQKNESNVEARPTPGVI